MTEPRFTGRTAFLTVQVDIPWEYAELIAEAGPAFVQAVTQALARYRRDQREDADSHAEQTEHLQIAKAEWAALADRCEAEIKRRANGSGQRQTIIKQLAEELKLSYSFLARVVRVHRQQRQAQAASKRTAEIIRLHMLGHKQAKIARWVGVSPGAVQATLEAQTDLIGALRVSASMTEAKP